MNARSGFLGTALLLVTIFTEISFAEPIEELINVSICWGNSKFTDDDFDHLVLDHKAGIIYLWSPLMPLSSQGREEIGPIADELGVDLATVVDPYADLPPTADPIMASSKLMTFGMLNHYPAIALYKNGHLIEDVLVLGYEKPKTLTQLLKSFFEKDSL